MASSLGVATGVGTGVGVGVAVGSAVGVAVGVGVGTSVGASVGTRVGVAVTDMVGVAVTSLPCSGASVAGAGVSAGSSVTSAIAGTSLGWAVGVAVVTGTLETVAVAPPRVTLCRRPVSAQTSPSWICACTLPEKASSTVISNIQTMVVSLLGAHSVVLVGITRPASSTTRTAVTSEEVTIWNTTL